jgi:hypothetical protein
VGGLTASSDHETLTVIDYQKFHSDWSELRETLTSGSFPEKSDRLEITPRHFIFPFRNYFFFI